MSCCNSSTPIFLSTPSARRATSRICIAVRISQISIHALREEGDKSAIRFSWVISHFYPRPPRGGRLNEQIEKHGHCEFLSTPSARRATSRICIAVRISQISIHALREEGDKSAIRFSWVISHFYPRPPRGGRRDCQRAAREAEQQFLSTPSARRATCCWPLLAPNIRVFLSTPSARRAT